MKVLVAVKRVVDFNVKVRVKADGSGVETANVKMSMNPFDEIAVEESIRLQEAGHVEEIVVVSMGPAQCQETIRTALAMGADRAVFVKDDGVAGYNSKGIAQALAAALKTESPELIFAGKQAVDDDASQVPERVAELLEVSHASVVTSFTLDSTTATVEREIEGGSYTLEIALPALITTQKGINTPRYPTLPNIMKAKRKTLKKLGLAELGGATARTRVLNEEVQIRERRNRILDGAADEVARQLARLLRDEAKVV